MIRAVGQAVGDVGHAICNAIAALGLARAPTASPDESGLFAENQRLRAALDAIETAAQKALDV